MQFEFTVTTGSLYTLSTNPLAATRKRPEAADPEQLEHLVKFGTEKNGRWFESEIIPGGKVGFIVDKGDGERGRWFTSQVRSVVITDLVTGTVVPGPGPHDPPEGPGPVDAPDNGEAHVDDGGDGRLADPVQIRSVTQGCFFEIVKFNADRTKGWSDQYGWINLRPATDEEQEEWGCELVTEDWLIIG